MSQVLTNAIQGFPEGCVFALLAVGLVLNYKTSGVFNLAFAAQAYVAASLFYVFRKDQEWPLAIAAILAIAIAGPLLGWLLDRSLYRHLRTESQLAKLITSLGLLVAIPELTKLILGFGDRRQFNPPLLWPVRRADMYVWFQGTDFALGADQITIIFSTLVVVVGLAVLFRRTALGLQMRAVVESPRLTELQGVDSNRVATVGWMLSSTIAALTGLLVAPIFGQLVSNDLFTLLVAALAATVIGRLTSIPLAFAGGVGLGMLKAILAGQFDSQSVFGNQVRPSLPFLVLFGLLVGRLVVARIRGRDVTFEKEISDPLSGVDPPPPVPVEVMRPSWMTLGSRIFGIVVMAVVFWLCWFVFNAQWLSLFVAGVCVGVIMLSMVMVTGIGGTLSLCQATLAAIGAFTTARLVQETGMAVLGAMFIGALVAAVIAALLAIPVIRLPTVYAALATIAFALMFETLLRPQEWVSGGSTPVRVPRPRIAGVDFADNRYFLLFAAAIFTLMAYVVILVRRGTTGRFLDAIRGSTVAAASIGISPTRQRLIAFTLAGAIAGIGGGLVATFAEQANYEANFIYFFGLVWVTQVVSAGARSVQSAIMSGIFFFVLPKLLENAFGFFPNWLASNPDTSGLLRTLMEIPNPGWAQGLAFVLFGFGAITYAKHPEGVIEFQTTLSTQKILAAIERRRGA